MMQKIQKFGGAMFTPVLLFAFAGISVGIGTLFTTQAIMGGLAAPTSMWYKCWNVFLQGGWTVFNQLPLLFAVSLPIGMAKKQNARCCMEALVLYMTFHYFVNTILTQWGGVFGVNMNAEVGGTSGLAMIASIKTLDMGMVGALAVSGIVIYLHNRFFDTELPEWLGSFSGSTFVFMIGFFVMIPVAVLACAFWPKVQLGITAFQGFVKSAGAIGIFVFNFLERALIPFGLHHVFYLPFWQTAVGGTMEVAGQLVQGGQNIFFAQLADPSTVHFSADATRYFSGEFIFMIFGLPGAALAMYQCAKPEKKKQAGGLLLSAALACMMTGITEPLEFSFLFVAPILFAVQVILAGSAYMIAHMLNIAVGLTFSGGFIDLFLFGILQGNAKTSWIRIIPVGIIYFFLYYIIFRTLILKLNLKTPGREDDDAETKLYTKADYKAKVDGNDADSENEMTPEDQKSALITRGLGGKKNISDVDCCATRLRCTVVKPELVNEDVLRMTSPSGIVRKGQGIQVIYGPAVSVIKSNLEDYLEKAPDVEYLPEENENSAEETNKCAETKDEAKKDENKTVAAGTVKKELCSPFTGVAAPIEEACDEAFAGKMMGDGYLVRPEEGMAYAPEDATVSFIFPSKHAVGLTSDDGTEYLLHIGVDTVNLDGKGFETFVNDGDRVKKGDKLIGFDIKYIQEHAKSDECMVVFTSLQEGEEIRMSKSGKVEKLEKTAEIVSLN